MELKSIIQHRHSTDGGRPNVGWILVVILLLGFVSCGADRNIKKGDKYLSLGEYYDAAEQYKQAYRRIPPKERKARGQVSKKIALANDYINSSAKAIAAYRNVIRYHQDSPETHLKLAGNLMKQGQYGDAEKEYQIVLDSLPGNKAAKEGLLAASEAPAEKKNASKYIVKKMDVFNSRRSDYSPMLFGDSASVWFARLRQRSRAIPRGVCAMPRFISTLRMTSCRKLSDGCFVRWESTSVWIFYATSSINMPSRCQEPCSAMP